MISIVSGGLILLEGGYDRWLLLYCGAWAIFGLGALLSIDDDLVQERFHPPNPGADRTSLRFVRLIALAHLVVGALDAGRWHLAPVAESLRGPALVVMVISAGLIAYAMRTNHFFSAVVRIQTDRGHHVVDRGPYAIIRHPGYLGMVVAIPFSGLALGSWLAVALGLVYSALVIRRVRFEDAFLQTNLTGYRNYVGRVRYRLVPGAW
jgi:protein-S-isoprenylcysteine O-methyltransferase Ste14